MLLSELSNVSRGDVLRLDGEFVVVTDDRFVADEHSLLVRRGLLGDGEEVWVGLDHEFDFWQLSVAS